MRKYSVDFREKLVKIRVNTKKKILKTKYNEKTVKVWSIT